MLVSGTMDINPDGSVRSYTMDHAEKIPPIVLTLIKQSAPTWRFLVNTKHNVIAQAKMSLRVEAEPVEDGKMAFSIEGVDFNEWSGPASAQLKERYMPPPLYPQSAIMEHVSATVYMILQIGRDGHVMELAPEQVNFTSPVSRMRAGYMERAFIATTTAGMRRWTFDVPTTGPDAGEPYWYACVPATFTISAEGTSRPTAAYGSWQPYLPGPHLALPSWMQSQTGLASAPDAIPDGGITQLHSALHLAAPARSP